MRTFLLLAIAARIAAADPLDDPGQRSPTTATMLSLGTSAASLATIYAGFHYDNAGLAMLGMSGLMVGGSTGHLYGARELGDGWKLRAVGGVAFVVGATVWIGGNPLFCIDGPCTHNNTGIDIMYGALALGVAGAVLDIATAAPATERSNARR